MLQRNLEDISDSTNCILYILYIITYIYVCVCLSQSNVCRLLHQVCLECRKWWQRCRQLNFSCCCCQFVIIFDLFFLFFDFGLERSGLALAFGCAFVACMWKAARDNGDKANVPSVKCSTLRLIYCALCTEYCVPSTLCCAQPTHALWAYTRTHTHAERGEANAYRHDHYADLWLQHLQLIARLPPLSLLPSSYCLAPPPSPVVLV